MSEAMKFSPSPRPSTSGQPRRARTMQSGLCAPTSRRARRRPRSSRDRPLHRLEQVAAAPRWQLDQVRDDLGVGLAT